MVLNEPCRLEEMLQNGLHVISSLNHLNVYDGNKLIHSFGNDVPGFDVLNDSEFMFVDRKRSIFNQQGVKIFELPFDREKRKLIYLPDDYRLLLFKLKVEPEYYQCTECEIFDTRYVSSPIYTSYVKFTRLFKGPNGITFVYDKILQYLPWSLNHMEEITFSDKIISVEFWDDYMDVFTVNERLCSAHRYKIHVF